MSEKPMVHVDVDLSPGEYILDVDNGTWIVYEHDKHDHGLDPTTSRTDAEQAVIDLTIKHHQHLAYMRDQPWHGRPVQPPDRVAANRQLRELEYALADAVDRLAASGPKETTP